MVEVALVLAASVSLWWRPAAVPMWAGPVVAALLAAGGGLISFSDAGSALGDLRAPLLFLVCAVPLAVTLDDIGVFAALAASMDGGRHLAAWLWCLAAGVVIVFNLDAAVVLLTPLYIRIARRHGLDAEALAFQPALLACLASGVLPVSNLTNLIVAARFDLGVGDFLTHLAAPSLLATAIGFAMYRRVFHLHAVRDRADDPVDPRALRRGLPIVGFVLLGFTIGDAADIEAWIVAFAALAWATAITRAARWRAVPVEAIAIAAGLVVVVATAVPHLGLEGWFDGTTPTDQLRAVGAATVMSNLANNLPTALAASEAVDHADASWPILIGTNIGSIFVLTASLSTLLWRDTAARNGVTVTPQRWSSVAARVGAPALIGATITQLLLAT
ncbi:MAG: SLC13 family permease [Acidimicrobiales bacterium]